MSSQDFTNCILVKSY